MARSLVLSTGSVDAVAPLAGAWIETGQLLEDGRRRTSRPSRARGLKQQAGRAKRDTGCSSRPSRARGLKHRGAYKTRASGLVAPLAGAWIETRTARRAA